MKKQRPVTQERKLADWWASGWSRRIRKMIESGEDWRNIVAYIVYRWYRARERWIRVVTRRKAAP